MCSKGPLLFQSWVYQGRFWWPEQTGATSYEVARSTDPQFFTDCLVHATTTNFWNDLDPVPSGVGFHYLVRSAQPRVGSWGADSSSVERLPVCP